MLAESTIKKEMRRLRNIVDDTFTYTQEVRDQAYAMETALQWATGGCDWTPSRVAIGTALFDNDGTFIRKHE